MARSTATDPDSSAKLDASMRILILRGPDQYLRIAYTRRLIDALRAEYGEIGQFSFDGETVEPAVVLDELRSYGLLQEHKLVIVDNADKFLAGPKDEEEPAGRAGSPGAKTARELMERYAANPVDSATLLLRADTWRPGRLDKAVSKVGTSLKCEAPKGAQAVNWCLGRCEKEYGRRLERRAAEMLVELSGTELARLDTELAKLAAYVGDRQTIGPDDVKAIVGLTREEQAWAVQAALLSGSPQRAVEKVGELLRVSRQPEQLVIWAMTDLVRKLHTASSLLKEGESVGAIAGQLKLWGESRNLVPGVARRLGPAPLARLLRHAIETDQRTKSGFGGGERTLEALALRIADTLRSA
jgi:DNA polymerase-3 subunit delta